MQYVSICVIVVYMCRAAVPTGRAVPRVEWCGTSRNTFIFTIYSSLTNYLSLSLSLCSIYISLIVVKRFWDRACLSVNHHGGVSASSSIANNAALAYDTVPPIMEVPANKDSDDHNQQQQQQQGTLYVMSVLRDGLSYLAVCPAEVSPLLVLEFLHRVANIFVEYFGPPADESAIKDNFSTVYQLLEEMVDYGWPLTTEPNALKAMIRPPTMMSKLLQTSLTVSDELPSGTVSNMPWRASNVQYSQNEIYIDIIEEVDAIVTASGGIVSSDISGSIQCQSHLSGIPDLLLTFKDPTIIDDCSFHPCVRYARFENEQIVSFVPPDGDFELMRYRITPDNTNVRNFQPPVYCHAQCVYLDNNNNNPDHNTTTGSSAAAVSPTAAAATTTTAEVVRTGRMALQAGVTSLSSLIFSASARKGGSSGPLQVEDVAVTIPFPKNTKMTKDFSVNYGNIFYDEAAKVARWTLGTMDASKKASLTCTFTVAVAAKSSSSSSRRSAGGGGGGGGGPLAAAGANWGDSRQDYGDDNDDDDDLLAPPNLSLHWKIPLSSVSGLAVSGLSITRESYRPYKGVRNITKSGLFQVRCT